MAEYSKGQQVCLAWPARNRVRATCNNPNLPEDNLKVYMSQSSLQKDVSSFSSLILLKDFGSNTKPDQFVGFQNCPKYCEDSDRALCTGCFRIPFDVISGYIIILKNNLKFQRSENFCLVLDI